MQTEKRLSPEQVKVAMYVKLIEEIVKNLNRYLYETKNKKNGLAELKAVSMKSCYAIRQMTSKFTTPIFTDKENEDLNKIETEISYEVVLGKVDNKFKWQYTKELIEYLKVLSENILKRNNIQRDGFSL